MYQTEKSKANVTEDIVWEMSLYIYIFIQQFYKTVILFKAKKLIYYLTLLSSTQGMKKASSCCKDTTVNFREATLNDTSNHL